MDCHHSTEGSEVTTIPRDTYTHRSSAVTMETLGILLDQLGQKAQGIPHVPTRSGIFKASIKLLVNEHRGLASPLEQGVLGIHRHCSKTRRGLGGCIGP